MKVLIYQSNALLTPTKISKIAKPQKTTVLSEKGF